MQSAMRGVLAVGTAFVVVGVGAILVLPRSATIERSIDIQTPPEAVYGLIVDMEKYQTWSPWAAMDPTIEVTYGDKKSGVGASYSWVGDDSGEGTLTVKEAIPSSRIVNDLSFGDMGGGTATWSLESLNGQTHVIWSVTTEASGPMGGVFALFADTMIGPSFEDGLNRLKVEAEKGS